jgi:hypothetical protein
VNFYDSTYEDIKKTIVDMGSSESSIEKALRSLGYESFPEIGLSDVGQSRLIGRILDIEHKEARLISINAEQINDKRVQYTSLRQSLEKMSQETCRELRRLNPKVISAKIYYSSSNCNRCDTWHSEKTLHIKGKVMKRLNDCLITKANYDLAFFEMCIKCGYIRKILDI